MRSDRPKILAALKANAETKTYVEIAKSLGVSPAYVVYVGRLAGFKKPYVSPKRRAMSKNLAALQEHAKTKTYAEIAELLGVSPTDVIYAGKVAGFKKPYVSPKRRARLKILAALKAHGNTKTYVEIAKLLGVSPSDVMYAGRVAGFKKRHALAKQRARLKILAALKRHARTKSYDEIGKLLGVAPSTVKYVGKLAGFKKPWASAKWRHMPKILAALKAHGKTKPYTEIADLLGLPIGFVGYVGRAAGFKKRHVRVAHRAKHARMREYFQAHARTDSMAQMGRAMGVTTERVRQLCNQWHIEHHRRPGSKLQLFSDRELRKVVHQPTKSFNTMAKELGVATTTLDDELRRRGIKPLTLILHNASLRKQGLETCCRCRRVMRFDQFTRNASSPTGHGITCLECARALTREWFKRKAARLKRRRA